MARVLSQDWFNHSIKSLDDIENTKDIIRKCIVYIEKNHKDWITGNDARGNLFIGIKKVLQSTQLSYLNMRYCLVDIEYWKKFIKEYRKEDIPQHIKEYNVLILTGWIYGISTIIEESFRLILRRIKPNACNNATAAFQSIYGCLLKEMKLQNYVALFDLFRLVRNCIHTNGVFYPAKQKDIQITYDGNEYEFIVGKKLDFVNFHFINQITQDIVVVLDDMVKDSRISTIDHIPRMGK